MPTGDRLYESTNTVGTNTKYKKGTTEIASTYEGLCKALAVLWCEQMINGKRDLLTKPSECRAGALQFKFEINWDSDVIFGLAGLESTEKSTQKPGDCLDHIGSHPGTYQIRVPGHAIAVNSVGSMYYFYDSESGLWKYKTKSKWKKDVLDEYDDGDDWTAWKLQRKM